MNSNVRQSIAQVPCVVNDEGNDSQNLLSYLHRGGSFAYLWASDGDWKRTLWYPVGIEPIIPASWSGANVYFGVHPTSVQRKPYERSTIDTVSAINCLFAEFDAKDFDGGKSGAMAHIDDLQLPANVIVDSGGGYHCYWILHDTITVDDSNREWVRHIQREWVKLCGADDGSKDITRVLRLPGTQNYKKDYAPDYPTVHFIKADFDAPYDMEELTSIIPPYEPPQPRERVDIDVSSVKASKYAKSALERELNSVATAANGTRNTTLHKAAFSLGQLVGESLLNESEVIEVLSSAAAGLGLPEREASSAINSGIKGGKAKGRILPESLNVTQTRQTPPDAPVWDEPPAWLDGDSNEGVEQFDFLKYDVSDLGDGECFSDFHYGEYAHVEAWGWLKYDGKSWGTEGSHLVRKKMTKLIRDRRSAAKAQMPVLIDEISSIENKISSAQDADQIDTLTKRHDILVSEYEKLKRIIGRVEKCSKSQLFGTADCAAVAMSETQDRFSCASNLINVGNGILDLRTGKLSPHNHEEGIMHLIDVDYNPDADCGMWCDWLEDIFEDAETLCFFQAYCGYMLTGYTSDERLLYVRGDTRSGKGTIQTVLQAVMGRKLSGGIPFNTFTRDRGEDGNRFDLAPLKDKRAIFASESEAGRRLNSAEVKTITGGDPIYCSYKGKDMFEYVPQFKISLFSNFPASGDPEDDALWARLACIDMKKSFLGKEDTTLKQRLTSKENLEAVLCWLVEGAKAWIKLHDAGLRLPESSEMKTVKGMWRGDLDHVRNWIEECCYAGDVSAELFTSNTALYNSYENYCRDNGVEPKKANSFGRALKTKGYESARKMVAGKRQKGFNGISLAS